MTAISLKYIKDRCVDEGECWIWQLATSQAGYPIVRLRPQPCQLVRRLVLELLGRPAQPRQPTVTTCGDKRCCNPDHIRTSTLKAIGRKAAQRGAFSSPARAAKIAAAKRASSYAKLSMDDARAIRASSEPGPVLALRYGIDKSMVNNIKRGAAWRDYSNPFAGLMQ